MLPCSIRVEVLCVWFSQPAPWISLHTIKGLIFVMEAGCFLCVVKTNFVWSLKVELQRVMPCPGTQTLASFQGSVSQICVGQSGTGTGFYHGISVLPCHCHYVSAPHLSLSSWCCFQEEDRRRSGNLHTTERSSRSDTELYLTFFKSSFSYWLVTSIPETFHFAGPEIDFSLCEILIQFKVFTMKISDPKFYFKSCNISCQLGIVFGNEIPEVLHQILGTS
jgi:hypothetical protein